MRIITVNLPVSYLQAIEKITGNKGFYPSRSELIRVAVRDFLIRELEAAKSFEQYQKQKQNQPPLKKANVDKNMYVQVPVGDEEYKTYKIVKK